MLLGVYFDSLYILCTVNFLDICGPGLFVASEKPADLFPPEPAKLLEVRVSVCACVCRVFVCALSVCVHLTVWSDGLYPVPIKYVICARTHMSTHTHTHPHTRVHTHTGTEFERINSLTHQFTYMNTSCRTKKRVMQNYINGCVISHTSDF